MSRLAAITIFAVKALRGGDRAVAEVEPWGLAGDRRYLVTGADHRFLTQRECPELARLDAVPDADGVVLSGSGQASLRVTPPGADAERVEVAIWKDRVPAHAVGPAADAWLTAAMGRPCRLMYMAEPDTARPVDPDYARAEDRVSFADGYPLLVASTASLADLNSRLPAPIGMDRFRPNLVVEGTAPWAEDGWRQLRIGPVLFDVVKPCARCIVTTTDQRSGVRDPAFEPIRTLQRFRRDAKGQVIFGQNLVPRSVGRVAVGDRVEVVASVGDG